MVWMERLCFRCMHRSGLSFQLEAPWSPAGGPLGFKSVQSVGKVFVCICAISCFLNIQRRTQFCIFMQLTFFSFSAQTDSVTNIFVMVLTTLMNPVNSTHVVAFQVT